MDRPPPPHARNIRDRGPLFPPRRLTRQNSRSDSTALPALSDRLAQLGEVGIVERARRPGRPPRVRHELTWSGHRLDPAFRALRD
ncbi:winged helix-turn-helix transcriptional regulator [Streptomyces heliomycini]|uniref:Winged helix-turn-helix transcriptional regulator n=1 Tax=Streptomyces heliomycini TaxID=284032 RepID=A0ABV5L8T3_9ACTN